ncbi:MAG: Maf family protein [Myxococcales bacterium]|nr:Maf family protein [Myxococcales bacterium]MDD9971480.1 Maf family protein [Myxococcales bacterium]
MVSGGQAQPRLVLASGSPRRREILEKLGLVFEVCKSNVEEPPFSEGDPADYALGLAIRKAEAVAEALPRACVLGADTIVVCDGKVLGKPCDDGEARRMITALAGHTHEVVTAVALKGAATGALVETTSVTFRALSPAEVDGYVATGEGRDKAGAYGVQGIGAGLVTRIEGSYSNVVGLPAAETLLLLRRAGVLSAWPSPMHGP